MLSSAEACPAVVSFGPMRNEPQPVNFTFVSTDVGYPHRARAHTHGIGDWFFKI